MSSNNNTQDLHTDAYWLQMDKLYAEAEEKNLKAAVKKPIQKNFMLSLLCYDSQIR